MLPSEVNPFHSNSRDGRTATRVHSDMDNDKGTTEEQ
jgi:hypothetical protein